MILVATNSYMVVCRLSIEHGGNIGKINNNGNSVYTWGTYQAILENETNINDKDSTNHSFLYCTNKNMHRDVCDLLQDHRMNQTMVFLSYQTNLICCISLP